MDCGQKTGIEDAGQVRSLIHFAGNDVVVQHRSSFGGGMPMLLPDHIQNGILDVQQNVLHPDHIAEMSRCFNEPRDVAERHLL